MITLPGFAERVRAAFRPHAGPLVYRAAALHAARTAAPAAAGDAAITLTGLPAGFAGVVAGDSFGGGVYSFTADTPAVIGVVTLAPFSPALKVALAQGSAVQVLRATDTPCAGWVEWLDVSRPMASPLIQQQDALVTILGDTLPFAPRKGDRLLFEGRAGTIENVGRDPAGAAWSVLVRGG